MPSMGHLYRWPLAVVRAKNKNHENSNTELELFELVLLQLEVFHMPSMGHF